MWCFLTSRSSWELRASDGNPAETAASGPENSLLLARGEILEPSKACRTPPGLGAWNEAQDSPEGTSAQKCRT